jgi:hypothetical protein
MKRFPFRKRDMSPREDLFNALCGWSLLASLLVYGAHFAVPGRVVPYFRIAWVSLLGLAVAFETTSRLLGRHDRRKIS